MDASKLLGKDRRIYDEGQQAFKAGKGIDTCPGYIDGRYELLWKAGWNDAKSASETSGQSQDNR